MNVAFRPATVTRAAQIVFWAVLVVTFALAVMPSARVPQIMPWDKAEHFLAFYVLTSLASAAFPRISLILLALWMSLFGCAIELAQAIPFIHRDCDFFDWVADACAIAAALSPMLVERWRRTILVAGG